MTTKRTAGWLEAMQKKSTDVASTSQEISAGTSAAGMKSSIAVTSHHSAKKKKLSTNEENSENIERPSTVHIHPDWRRSIVDLERKRFETDDQKRQLECYNLALQNINLERQLGSWFSLCCFLNFVLVTIFKCTLYTLCKFLKQISFSNLVYSFQYVLLISELSGEEIRIIRSTVAPALVDNLIYSTEYVDTDDV